MTTATTGAQSSVEWSDLSDADLVKQYRSFGFASAFRELVNRYQTPLYRLVLGLSPSAVDAEVLCEKCFLRAERSLGELADPDSFYPWLASIARELAVGADQAPQQTAMPGRMQRGAAPRSGLQSAVLDVLGKLSPEDRMLLVLSELQGQSPTQMAAAVGAVNGGAVRELLASAQERFQAALANVFADDASEPSPVVEQRRSGDVLLAEGTILDGRYRIVRPIGRGGMGVVYRAHQLRIERDVAIKLLTPPHSNIPELRRRFQREAVVLGRLGHKNFVDVIDSGQLEDGSEFISMELLDGETLADLLQREGCIEPLRALHMVRHVLQGLARAHSLGILHRDIKPGNLIVLEHDGDCCFVKIFDLGIARVTDDADVEVGDTQITEEGITFGTPRYLSPEQAVGKVADERSDLYSVTVSLFEMVAGRPPFRCRDGRNVLAMHVSKPPPPVAAVAPEVKLPRGLQAILDRGLAKARKDRFQSAEEYLAAIAEILPEDYVPSVDSEAAERRSRALATTGKPVQSTKGLALAATLPLRAIRALRWWLVPMLIAATAAVVWTITSGHC